MTDAKPKAREDRTIPHHGLIDADVGIDAAPGGSKVFHLDDVPVLGSERDGRRKRVLLNAPVTGKDLLVDVLDYAPGGTSPLHYHRGTDHFFFVLEGRGRIVINDREYPLGPNTVVWIAEGDVHKVFADPDVPLRFLEYFSCGRHETVFLEQACEWRPAGT
ncbi:MAG: cupin domain-containing protein [Armatimonadota bacterium]|nr:cupin domain-containing protein [Armatimonadota bacterium]